MKTKGVVYKVMVLALGLAAVFIPACATRLSENVGCSIYIDAPPGEVYDWLINPENQETRNPGQTLTNLSGGENFSSYDFSIEFMGRTYQGEQVMVGVPDRLILETCTGDVICSVTYTLVPQGSGTKMTRESEYVADLAPQAALNRKKLNRELQQDEYRQLQLIKAEVEK